MINEVSGEYAFSDMFKIKGGRFLTPLSPVNSFYFAPVNVGITLPMLISHHEYYPLNLNGLSVNGNFGGQFKINYNVFAGGYYTSLWKGTGPLNFFGNEDDYFRKLDHLQLYSSLMQAENLNFGGGGHLGLAFSDYVEVGVNYFTSKPEYFANMDTVPDPSNTSGATRNITGLNFKLHYNFIQITGEQWWSNLEITNIPIGFNPATFQLIYGTGKSKLKGSFYELTCNYKTLTPFVRYEYHKAYNIDLTDLIFHKYSFGLNYKPRYEINLKCEVVHYDHPKHKIDGILASLIYSF
jgi:hypothetical protein